MPTYDYQSVEIAASDSAAQNYAPSKANQTYGRVRRSMFTYAFLATESANDLVHLAKIPIGARMWGGVIASPDLGTTFTIDIGLAGADGSGYIDADNSVADDPNFFTTAALDPGAGAGAFDFGKLAVDNPGYETEKATDLYLKIVTTGTPSAGTITGYVDYTVD